MARFSVGVILTVFAFAVLASAHHLFVLAAFAGVLFGHLLILHCFIFTYAEESCCERFCDVLLHALLMLLSAATLRQNGLWWISPLWHSLSLTSVVVLAYVIPNVSPQHFLLSMTSVTIPFGGGILFIFMTLLLIDEFVITKNRPVR
jgi:hypothetical protein